MVETIKSKPKAKSKQSSEAATSQTSQTPAIAQSREEQSRQRAAAILEVLAGNLRPADAAAVLEITTSRYYMLEERAIKGLVKACEPLNYGPTPSPAQKIAQLEKRCAKLEQDLMRQHALTRVAQRAVGMHIDKTACGGKGTRRPTVRALKAAKRLKAGSSTSTDTTS